MTEVFADTFYFIALLNPSDRAFLLAKEATANQRSVLVTTTWVLTELANTLRRGSQRIGFLNTLRSAIRSGCDHRCLGSTVV